jgi:hypothetical protein
MAVTDEQFEALQNRVTKLEGLTVKTSEIAGSLARMDGLATVSNATVAALDTRVLALERKVNLLTLQVDPVIAGTTRTLHGANDEEVLSDSATYVTKKSGRINRSQFYFFTKLYMQAELRVQTGTRAWLGLFVDGALRAEVSTTAAAYTNVTLNWDWTGLSDDIWYPIEYKIKVEGGGYVHNRALELYVHKPGVAGGN